MKNKKRVWFSPFVRVVPADYETWLEDLAMQGWNIDKIGQWSSICMDFTRTRPRRYRYVFDMQISPHPEYLFTYEQFGWEYVGQMASAIIWRKEYKKERPESFTDQESLERRNRRVLAAVSVNFWLFLAGGIAAMTALFVTRGWQDAERLVDYGLSMALCDAFALYLGYVMRQIRRNLQR